MKHDDEKLAEDIVSRLRDADERLDAETVRRLAEARKAALRQMPAGRRYLPRQWLVPGLALASAMALVIGVAVWQASPVVPATGVDVLDIVAARDGLDLYEDIEFYQWLAEQRQGAG